MEVNSHRKGGEKPESLKWGELRPHHSRIALMLRDGHRYDEIADFISESIGKPVAYSTVLNYVRRHGLRNLSPVYRPLPSI